MMIYKSIASVGGIGYIRKGGGSVAALAYCILLMLVPVINTGLWPAILLTLVLVIGVWTSGLVEEVWGHDSYRIVIDEVAGMMIAVFLVPVHWKGVLTGFVLFRFFDIVKPFGIRNLERLPGGWGVMGDDVLAGVYAYLVLRLIMALNLL